MSLDVYLAERRALVDKALDDALPETDGHTGELRRAMRYSIFAGGKRVRPILAMAAAEAVGATGESVLPLAVALECVHTYSLIHDDLPAMDNDDMRRGKPALHRAFSEATAILAGDALLTVAFEHLTSPHAQRIYPANRILEALSELALAAGSERLIAGQFMDVTLEGKTVDIQTVDAIVSGKTAALIAASLTCGARLAEGSREEIAVLGAFGADLGRTFQIRDDLLDLEGDPRKLGKAVNKDGSRGKATYPNLIGVEQSKVMMKDLVESAIQAIEPLGDKGLPLKAIARYVAERVQ